MANTLTSSGGAAALVFESTEFDVIDQAGQPWLRGPQIGDALGYAKAGRISIHKLYESNKAEFTDSMTALVKLPTAGGEQETRIFSLRGAHLLAMFARTAIAALFRKWVLDILDAQLQAPRIAYTAGPQRWLTTVNAQGIPTVEPVPVNALLCTVAALPELTVKNIRLFTDTQVQAIAMQANLRMIGNMCLRQENTEFVALKNTVRNLGGNDLYEIMKQGHMELSLRTSQTQGASA